MSKQRVGQRSPAQQTAAPAKAAPAAEEEELEAQELEGNQAVSDQISGTQGASAPPTGNPMDDATSGEPDEVPFLADVARGFGQHADVDGYTGKKDEMAAMGAQAAARPGEMVFADQNPDKETVAEEYAHVLQFGNAGVSAAGSGVSSPTSQAETEAKSGAAEVARGGVADIVGQAPAVTHRRETGGGEPPKNPWADKGSVENIGSMSYRVFTDKDWDSAKAKRPEKEDGSTEAPKWIDRSGYTQEKRKVEDTKAAKELIAEIVKIVEGTKPHHDFAWLVSAAVAARSPGARVIAFESDELWGADALKDADIALKIAKGLDPVEGLRSTLNASGKSTLANLKSWTKNYPDYCDRALEDGGIQVAIQDKLEGDRTEARLYLLAHGDWTVNPKDTCYIAIEKQEDSSFITAWKSLGEEDKRSLVFDNLFLHSVRENLPSGYAYVSEFMATLGIEQGYGVEFSDKDKDALQGPADETVSTVRKSIIGKDIGTALAALEGYRDTVMERLKHHDGSAEGKDTAIKSVGEGMRLVTQPINDSVSSFAISMFISSMAIAGKADEAQRFNQILTGGTAELAKLFVDYDTDLTEADTTYLDQILPPAIERLQALTMPLSNKGSQFMQELGDLRVRLHKGIISELPGDHEADWAASERRRKAVGEMKRRFEDKTGTSIETAIKISSNGMMEGMALGILENMETEAALEDNPDLYSPDLSDLDKKRLKDAFSGWGSKMNDEFHRWNTRDDTIIKFFRGLDKDIRRLTKPKVDKPAIVKQWNDKIRAAQDYFVSWYNGAYEGLASEITDHINQPQCDEARRIVGIHRDENAGAGDELLAGEGNLAMAEQVESWKKICASTAQTFEDILGGALTASTDWGLVDWAGMISDSKVTSNAFWFSHMKATYVATLGEEFAADASNYLLREFKARGGKIQPAIRRACSEDNANKTFELLGISGSTAAKVDLFAEAGAQMDELKEAAGQPEEAKKAADQAQFEKEMGGRIDAVSRALVGDFSAATDDESKKGWVPLVVLCKAVATRAFGYQNGKELLQNTWKSRLGIPLENDIGLHVKFPLLRTQLADAFQIDPSTMPKPSGGFINPQAVEVAKEMAVLSQDLEGGADQSKLPPELQFNEQGVKDGFDLEVAAKRAAVLQALVSMLPASRDKVEMALVGPNGMKEETRVTLEVYKKMYGHSLKYALRMAYRDTPEEADRINDFATGAFNKTFVNQMLAFARYGDAESARKAALKASPDEKKALFDDDDALGKMRQAFGESSYKIIYRAITDQVTMYELIEDRGGNAFGWDTDEDGVKDDFKNWFDGKRIMLMKDPELNKRAGGDPKKLKELVAIKMKEMAARTFADPNVSKQIDHEFSGDEQFEMEALLLNQGQESGSDKVITDTIGLGTTDSIWADMENMSNEERAKLKNSPLALSVLAEDLENEGSSKRDQAFEELFSEQGSNQEAKFEELLKVTPNTQNGHYKHGGGNTNEFSNSKTRKFFDQVFSMGPKELAEFKKDRVRLNELRSRLSDEDLVKLDNYLASQSKAIEDNGGTDPQTDDQKKTQKREWLVTKFTGQFLAAIQGGGDAILAVAQAAFTEKGEIEVEVETEKDGVKSKKKEKVSAFDRPAHQQVWKNINSEYDKKVNGADVTITDGTEIYCAVRDSLWHPDDPKYDPAGLRYDYAVSGSRIIGMESEDAAMAAINGASSKYALENWSNVKNKGVGGNATAVPMVDKYTEMTTARAAVEDAMKRMMDAKATGPLEPDLAAAFDTEISEKNTLFQVKYRNFKQHELDLSFDAFAKFGETDRVDTKDSALGYDRGKDANKKITAVQKKLLTIEATDMAESCGATEDDQYFASDVEQFMNDDRKTRATWQHDKQQYNRQADGSMADGTTNADEELDLAYMMYTAEVGESISGQKGIVGEITDEEKARIDDKKGNFDKKLEEYKAAKTAFADILKWIAIAIITVVATALTGPGGPTLLAALLTGAATGAAKAGIDELVQGNDYDFATEGVQTILVETLTSVATVGLGKAVKFAGGKFPGVQNTLNRYDKFLKWEEAVKEGATKSLPGFAGNLMYETGKATVMAPLAALKDTAVESLDLSVWKYGTFAGVAHTEDVFDDKMGSLDEGLRKQYLDILINNTMDLGAAAIFGKNNDTLEGIDTKKPDAEKTSLAMSVLSDVVDANSPDKLAGAIRKQGVDMVVDKMMKGTLLKSSGWDADELTAFVKDLAKGQLDKSVSAAAGAMQDWNNAKLQKKRIDEAKSGAFKGLSGKELEWALEHYTHYLETDAHMYGGGEELGEDPEKWLQKYQKNTVVKVKTHVTKKFAESGSTDLEAKAEYTTWLMENPGKTNDRMAVDFNEFRKANQKAKNTVYAIKNSDNYKSLSVADRRFYDEYLSDSDRLISQDAVSDDLKIDGVDIRDSSGLKDFKTMLVNTRATIATNIVLSDKDDKYHADAFNKWLRENPSRMGGLSPDGDRQNKRVTESLFDQFALEKGIEIEVT